MKVEENEKLQPNISLQLNDLVIVCPYDFKSNNLHNACFFLGVVDSVAYKEGELVIKTLFDKDKIKASKEDKQRYRELLKRMDVNTEWQIKWLSSINQVNRQYLALNGVAELEHIQEYFLDPDMSPEVKVVKQKKINEVPHIQKGIQIIEGDFLSGKT